MLHRTLQKGYVVKVLVCGGRDFSDADKVDETLDAMHAKAKITVLIHGAARGADSLAEAWAISRFVRSQAFPVHPKDWEVHGLSAGHLRNAKMLLVGKPDLVVAFQGGKGTRNMIKQALDAGVEVRRIK